MLAGATLSVPLVVSVPVQPPLPAQDAAFLLVHFNVVDVPAGMVVAEAVKLTVGAGAAASTVKTVEDWPVPFGPVQVSE